MPGLTYLSINHEAVFTEDWQVYAFIVMAVIAIVLVIVVIFRTRKW